MNCSLVLVRKIMDLARTLEWSWTNTEPYGYQAPNDLHTSTKFTYDGRFPGQRFDASTGALHNGFRTYSPKLGRYIQSDPMGLAAGWNGFSYVGNAPTQGSDVMGLSEDDYKNKIPSMLNKYMQEMVSMGIRRPGTGWINASRNNFASSWGYRPYMVCSGQADYTFRRMNEEKSSLDDWWEFHRINNGAHHWLFAVSSNPNDPILRIDPWEGTVLPGQAGYIENVPYWGEDHRPHLTKNTVSDEAAENTRRSWQDLHGH